MCIRNSIGLIFYPYNTMRRISQEKGKSDLLCIMFLSIVFFSCTFFLRNSIRAVIPAICIYGGSILFFSALPGKRTFTERMISYVRTWSYTLLPTLIWFYTNMCLFLTLPPPRTLSIAGKTFSVLYIAFSVSLLIWKIILVYLSIRFSSRVFLYRIIYYILLYISILLPTSILLYHLGFSRIPFV